MPSAPVPSPRPSGDDGGPQIPQPREPMTSDPTPDVAPDAPEPPDPPVLSDPRGALDDVLDASGIADPREPLDDEPDVAATVDAYSPAPQPAPGRIYADGSALAQYLGASASHEPWLEWAADHELELITTPLGLTELRRIALPAGVEARGVAHEVQARIEVVRFSDQTLRAATKVSGVLPPFVALHIGAALAHPGVVAVATYETQLAQVAALHGLRVVSPGRDPFWWERGG